MSQQIRRDDFEMIKQPMLDEISKVQGDPRKNNEVISDIEIHEPTLWKWFCESRLDEIDRMCDSFPDVYNIFPTMPVYINGMMLFMFMRGYLAAESKWKCEPPINSGGFYNPQESDFA